ncbi:Tyr recombinase domain-containing protein [Frankia sp. Hr75.2]|nr:Tyr recombinase domain-containing protein [Frankia sp. Hr75.2]
MTRPLAAAGRRDQDDRRTTFDVRIWKINAIEGRTRTTYQVRWKVAGRPKANAKNFATRRLAESRHAELLAATRRGEAFDIETGIPVTELRAVPEPDPVPARSWLEHARDFADLKWWSAAPKSRAGIADALATVTPALLTAEPPAVHADLVREALYQWLFRTGVRTSDGGPHKPRTELDAPAHLAGVLDWLAGHTRPVADLAEAEVARAALDRLARKLDGKPAAATTIARKRAVFFGALDYAVERKDLEVNPLMTLKWTAPKQVEQVDRRVVCNHGQARALLDAVRHQGDTGRHLVAYYATAYYAGLRPGEINALGRDTVELPAVDAADQWGVLRLATSRPATSSGWQDDPTDGEEIAPARQLKHRALGDTRPVPACPLLVTVLRDHIETFGFAPDGRLFRGVRGGEVSDSVTGRVWGAARSEALTSVQAASPLARRIYDLRHACLSGWLNAGVSPQQVAEWAGHSVAVLLRVYAKCVDGDDVAARKRIEAALRPDGGR